MKIKYFVCLLVVAAVFCGCAGDDVNEIFTGIHLLCSIVAMLYLFSLTNNETYTCSPLLGEIRRSIFSPVLVIIRFMKPKRMGSLRI